MTPEKIAAMREAIENHPHFSLGGDALSVILDHISAQDKRIAELEAGRVVVPDDTFTLDLDEFGKSLVCITINSKNRGVGYELCGTMGDGHFSRRTFDITPYLAHCLNTIGVRAIPADRGLREGQVAVDREDIAKTFKAGFEFAKDWRNNPSNSEYVNEFFDLRAQAGKGGG